MQREITVKKESNFMNSESLRKEVIRALDEIRPFLQNDGGDLTLIDIIDDKIVHVRLEGTCTTCAINQLTLKSGVEMTIKKYAPQIEQVISV
jgi:nitrogen-fixing nifU domain protein